MPQVSVIIPTYNRAALVCDAIASVLAQSYRDFEIIVADDGSTDETASAVGRFGSNVRYLPLPHRGQPAATRNAGLAVATGNAIAFLDSDDLFLPDKLARQMPALEDDPSIALVYSDGYYFDVEPTQAVGAALDGFPTPSGDIFADLLRGNFIMTPALALVRRSVLEAAGGFNEDPELVAVEDYDLWLRLALQIKALYLPGNVAAIRRHGQNLSANALRHRLRIQKVYRRLEQHYPEAISHYALARHEAYARNHGSIASAALHQRRWGLALSNAGGALWHTLQLPGFGIQVARDWWKRHRLRTSAYQIVNG